MFVPIRRVTQITLSHCGPAVLQMLLDAMGIEVSQEAVAIAGEAQGTIAQHGMRVDQLARACQKLAPGLQFWYKFEASLDDLRTILAAGYGVGVEWQGLFYKTEEEEMEEEGDESDFGHYSIISHIDEERDAVIIVDPHEDFVNQERVFPINRFLRRWWDTNEVRDLITNQKRIIEDRRLLFFITPAGQTFPPEYSFKPYAVNFQVYYPSSLSFHS